MHTQTSMLAVKVRYFYSAKETISRPAQWPTGSTLHHHLAQFAGQPSSSPPHLLLGLTRVGGSRLNPCFVLPNNNPYWCLFWQVFRTPLKWGHGLAGRVSWCTGKLCLRGADLLPASLLCSQGNEKRVGVNHQAALRTTVSESASQSGLLGPAEAWSAPTGTGGGSAPTSPAICTGEPWHLPHCEYTWGIRGKMGRSFRNKCSFWTAFR